MRAPIDYICQHFGSNLSVDSLAGACNISVSALERRFKKHLKKTPHQYINEVRLDNARQMLLETDKPIGTIALETGFADHSHFTRAFTGKFGVAPRASAPAERLDRTGSARVGLLKRINECLQLVGGQVVDARRPRPAAAGRELHAQFCGAAFVGHGRAHTDQVIAVVLFGQDSVCPPRVVGCQVIAVYAAYAARPGLVRQQEYRAARLAVQWLQSPLPVPYPPGSRR